MCSYNDHACLRASVCVCACFWGSPECAGDGFLGIIDIFYYRLKEIIETARSIYSNQGCVFFSDNLICEVICLNFYVYTTTDSSFPYLGVGDVSSLTLKGLGGRIHP